MASPWDATGIDVNTIHDKVFQACLNGVDDVRSNQRSSSLLIHGEAGSGKTHLLRRLRSQLAPQVPPSTDRDECLFVWIRLQTSPRMIWRTVRRTLVEDWFRPVRGGKTQFERILFHRLARIRTAEGDLERWYEFILDNDPAGLKVLMDQIADSLHLDRNTTVAFEHIAFQRHLRDLRAWLSGDSLPEAALARMDLSQDEGTDEEREETSRQIVLMLCKLAGDSLPILISFDQVEALEMFPGDHDGLYSFGQVTSSLHDGTNNTFIVSCVQSTFALSLRDQARQADYARMTSLGAMSLDPLSRAEAEQLIAARLSATGTPVPAHAAASRTWPLTTTELDQLFAKGAVTPRILLGLCAERFETEQNRSSEPTSPPSTPSDESGDTDGSLTNKSLTVSTTDSETTDDADLGSARDPQPATVEPSPVETLFKDRWATTCEDKLAVNAPEKTEDIIRHALPLLVRILAPDAKLVRDEVLQDVTLLYETASGRTGLSICSSPNMTSLAAQLKRLKAQLSTSRMQRLGIIRDDRVPLSATAKVARQTLDELEKNAKVFFLRPSAEALAALDALRTLLTEAKSGDLDCHGKPVAPQTLEEWFKTHLPDHLRDLVDEVLGQQANTNSPDTHDLELLNTLLASNAVLNIDEAVRALKKDRAAISNLVRKYPDQIGFITGDPDLLFRPVQTGDSKPA